MTGRRRVGRVVGRATLVLVVVGGLVVAGIAVRDRAEVRASAHDLSHEAVADLVAVREGRARIEGLAGDVDASEAAQRQDDLATVEIITALDERETLQDRIELAQLELDRAREVSADQLARLEVLKGCVHHLELARARYVAGDRAGAVAAQAVGEDVCLRAEAITEGVTAVHPFDFPDPHILRDGNSYHAFGTNGPAGVIQVVSSTDLTDWDVQGPALDAVPGWAQEGFTWAPAAIRTWTGFSLFYTVRDMARAAGRWILLYSGNRWDSGRYATGYATCAGPTGPCAKPAENVVLGSDGDREGPGGAELFRTTDGQLQVAYAAWDAGEVGIPNPRRLHLGTVSMTPLGLRIS